MIIAFCGQQGSGKTTCARFIEELAPKGYKVERFSFAAPLKQAASLIFGPTFSTNGEEYRGMYSRPPAFYGTQVAKNMERPELGGRTGRELLQDLGTLCRGFDEDVFLRHLARSAPGVIQVIDDLRYPNEAEHVRRLRGVVVGLQVAGEPFEAVGHASESELVTHFDAMTTEQWFVERGDLSELSARCEGLMAGLPPRRAR